MLTPPAFADVARVLRALPLDLESYAHTRFRRLGGDAQRWQRRDVWAAALALTALEDRLEAERPRFDRTELRDLRRRLEDAAEVSARRAA